MKLHTLLTIATLSFASFASQAALVQQSQTQTYQGTAGNTSKDLGVDPFRFNLFNAALGTLQAVYVNYTVNISGGIIGADNQTNQVVNGSVTLGASTLFESSRPFWNNAFQNLFTLVSASKTTSIRLAADPTLSLGGSGPDVTTILGSSFNLGLPQTQINSMLQSNFVGLGQFNVDFTTAGIMNVNAPGSRGFFDAPNVDLNMTLTYVYDAPDVIDPPADVTSPALSALSGLALIGFAGLRRRRS